MPDQSAPPQGDLKKAEKYLTAFINLIHQDKLEVTHTDLNQFDPNSLQDHYRLVLDHYQVEISHSKLPQSGKDNFIMLFTNIKHVGESASEEECAQKIILSYIHLSESQFLRFKTAADSRLYRIKQKQEEERFEKVMSPFDEVLETMAGDDNIRPHSF